MTIYLDEICDHEERQQVEVDFPEDSLGFRSVQVNVFDRSGEGGVVDSAVFWASDPQLLVELIFRGCVALRNSGVLVRHTEQMLAPKGNRKSGYENRWMGYRNAVILLTIERKRPVWIEISQRHPGQPVVGKDLAISAGQQLLIVTPKTGHGECGRRSATHRPKVPYPVTAASPVPIQASSLGSSLLERLSVH